MMREDMPKSIKGAGALLEALDLIGAAGRSDGDIAKIVVEHELELREFLKAGLYNLAREL